MKDGRIATSSRDNTVRIWDLGTKACLQTFLCQLSTEAEAELEPETVNVHFVEKGLLALSSCDGSNSIYLYNADTNKIVKVLEGVDRDENFQDACIEVCVFDKDRIAASANNNTISIWNWKTGELLQRLGEDLEIIFSIQYLGDDLLATIIEHRDYEYEDEDGDEDEEIEANDIKEVFVWNLATGTHTVLQGGSEVYFCNTNQYISHIDDIQFSLHDSRTGREIRRIHFPTRFGQCIVSTLERNKILIASNEYRIIPPSVGLPPGDYYSRIHTISILDLESDTIVQTVDPETVRPIYAICGGPGFILAGGGETDIRGFSNHGPLYQNPRSPLQTFAIKVFRETASANSAFGQLLRGITRSNRGRPELPTNVVAGIRSYLEPKSFTKQSAARARKVFVLEKNLDKEGRPINRSGILLRKQSEANRKETEKNQRFRNVARRAGLTNLTFRQKRVVNNLPPGGHESALLGTLKSMPFARNLTEEADRNAMFAEIARRAGLSSLSFKQKRRVNDALEAANVEGSVNEEALLRAIVENSME